MHFISFVDDSFYDISEKTLVRHKLLLFGIKNTLRLGISGRKCLYLRCLCVFSHLRDVML